MLRHEPEKQADDQYGTETRAEKIEKINLADRAPATGECEADTACGKEKRNEKQQVNQAQARELPRIPYDLECVERHVLAKGKTRNHRDAEKSCAGCKRRLEVQLQPAPQKRDRRAAGTIPKERKAYDHVREVVPLDDRQHAHQQKLVADCSCGN